MKTKVIKKPLFILLPLIVIGVVVLSMGVFWGEERTSDKNRQSVKQEEVKEEDKTIDHEYEKNFISLFQEIEAAGDYESIWIEATGDSQFVKHSSLVISDLKQGQIPFAKVNSLFEEIERKGAFQLKDFYPPADPNILYESGYSILTIYKNSKFKRIVFHTSAIEIKESLRKIIDLINQTILLLHKNPLYGVFINSSEMFTYDIFKDVFKQEGISNWQLSISYKNKALHSYNFSVDQLRQYPELLESILKPEAFIHINLDRENLIRTLAKGEREFYIKYKDKEFIIRFFDRKKS